MFKQGLVRWIGMPIVASVASIAALFSASAEELSNEELAKLAQNPIANLISVPFQNNTNFNYGRDRGVQDILNIQPVIPISLTAEWNLITRTILPVIFNPPLGQGIGAVGGIGDVQISGFLPPTAPSAWIWDIGPIIQLPTHSSTTLGNDNLGLGPTGVLLHLRKGDPWVFGALVNTV